MWEIYFSPHFERAFHKLSQQLQKRLKSKIIEFVNQKNFGEALHGYPLQKWRVGDYRILFELHRDKKEVLLSAIGKRDSIYKKL